MILKIECKKVMEHYEIYVDGEFELSCDINELKMEVQKIKEKYNKKFKNIIVFYNVCVI